MADALYTIHIIAMEPEFQARLNAGAAKEQVPGEPTQWVWNRRYTIAAAPSWAEKVDYWLLSNPDADPPNGWALDVAVITDDDITSQIQAVLTAEIPAEASNG